MRYNEMKTKGYHKLYDMTTKHV